MNAPVRPPIRSAGDGPPVRAGSVAGSARWNLLGNTVRVLVQLLTGIVLARILGPSAFGPIAAAWLVIGLGKLFADFGFSASLVQAEAVSRAELRTVFLVQLAVGLVLSALMAGCSPLLARAIGLPDAAPVLVGMAPMFALQALGQASAAMLSRRLAHRTVQLISVASQLVGHGMVGIPMAVYGFGVWSIVAAQLCQTALASALLMHSERIPLRGTGVAPVARHLRFGAKVLAANLSSWALNSVDALVIGRYFGAAALGGYNRALNLILTPVNVVVGSAQSTTFAAASRLRSDGAARARGFLLALALVCAVTMPLCIVSAAIGPTVVEAVFGPGWLGVAGMFRSAAMSAAFFSILALVGPTLMAIDRTGDEVKAQCFAAPWVLLLLVAGAELGIEYLLWCVPAGYCVRMLSLLWQCRKRIGFRWSSAARPVVVSMLLSLAIALPIHGLDLVLRQQQMAVPAMLVVEFCAAASLYMLLLRVALAWLMPRELGAADLAFIGRVKWLASWLRLKEARP